MTDEQINLAMADAMGWRKEDGVYVWTANGIDCTCDELWDWANDLNAMHLAEQIIVDTDLFFDYCLHTGPLLRATARQRAEAFLRTLGKWEEAK